MSFSWLRLAVLSISIVLSGQASRAVDPAQKPQEKAPLRSPLLRGLQQSVEQSEAFEESGIADQLMDQLVEADGILASIKAENRYAMKLVKRQPRIGAARQSPNILLISIDRLGWNDLGCYGQKISRTPHLDRLAAEGLRLTQYYAASSDRSAARWSMLTGLSTSRPARSRQPRFRIDEQDTTLAETLWDAGYVTAWFGLWDNGDRPDSHGFESWSGFTTATEAMQDFPESIHVDSARIQILDNTRGQKSVASERILASELQSWLQGNKGVDRQFFAHVAISAFPEMSDAPLDRTAVIYKARIERADRLIGAVLAALEASGERSQTAVFLVAESGPDAAWHQAVTELQSCGEFMFSDHGLSEGNIRVPAIVRWPGRIKPGLVDDSVTSAWDLIPTFCNLSLAQRRPRQLDGHDQVSMLTTGTHSPRGLLYWETATKNPGQAVLKDGWKAVRLPGQTTVSLFQLDTDPREAANVASQHPDELEKLIIREKPKTQARR